MNPAVFEHYPALFEHYNYHQLLFLKSEREKVNMSC